MLKSSTVEYMRRFSYLVITLTLFSMGLLIPSPIFAAKTCTVTISQSAITYGNTVTVSYSGQGDPGQNVDLFLERWQDAERIDPPLNLQEVTNGSRTYYKMGICVAGQSCQVNTPSDLPPGKYFTHCQISYAPDPCSGNPYCSYENWGGSLACAGYQSCSNGDNALFVVKPSEVSSISVVSSQIPTALPLQFTSNGNRQTAALKGVWYIKPDRGSSAFQPINVPNFWRRWFISSAWFVGAPFSDAFRNTPEIRDQTENPYRQWTGTVIYVSKFTLPTSFQNKNIRLRFDAVAAKAEVFVNGNLVGRHLGGFDPFTFDIHPYLTFGTENVVSLRVTDSSPYEGLAFSTTSNWTMREQGGIWRDVTLISTNKEYIKHFSVTTPTLNSAQFNLDVVNSENSGVTYTLSAEIKDKATNQVVSFHDIATTTIGSGQTVTLNPRIDNLSHLKPWSPEYPYLYDITLYLKKNDTIVDQTTKTTGFRTFTVSTDGTKFLLNGQRYFLKGTGTANLHQISHPDPEFMGTFIARLKEAGVNAIRLHLGPAHILDEFDKAGILVFAEFPTLGGTTSTVVLNQLKTEMRSYIKDSASHPSLVIYSLANENILFDPGNNLLRQQLDELIVYLKANADNTRLYLSDSGCLTFKTYGSSAYTGNLADICGNQTDLTDTHWYYFWYAMNKQDPFIAIPATQFKNDMPDFTNALNQLFNMSVNKPHIFTEFGGVYTDEQGNLWPKVTGTDPLGKPTTDSDLSVLHLGTNPSRPSAALNYQAQVTQDTVSTLLNKRNNSRLAGLFYFNFDSILYNTFNFPLDKIKQWYVAAYSACQPNLPCITDQSWQNHMTLEPKPAYNTLKSLYTSTPAYFDVNCTVQLTQPIIGIGSSATVNFSSQGAVGQSVDLFLTSWPNGSAISPPPGTASTDQSKTYYKLGSCIADGGACSVSLPTSLPQGQYYLMCNTNNPQVGVCSGNPFCPYENLGGIINCIGWSSCSTLDNALLTIGVRGDVNWDGVLNGDDRKEVISNYTKQGVGGFIRSDLFAEGRINSLDFTLTVPFITTSSPVATPVSTPWPTPRPTPAPTPQASITPVPTPVPFCTFSSRIFDRNPTTQNETDSVTRGPTYYNRGTNPGWVRGDLASASFYNSNSNAPCFGKAAGQCEFSTRTVYYDLTGKRIESITIGPNYYNWDTVTGWWPVANRDLASTPHYNSDPNAPCYSKSAGTCTFTSRFQYVEKSTNKTIQAVTVGPNYYNWDSVTGWWPVANRDLASAPYYTQPNAPCFGKALGSCTFDTAFRYYDSSDTLIESVTSGERYFNNTGLANNGWWSITDNRLGVTTRYLETNGPCLP